MARVSMKELRNRCAGQESSIHYLKKDNEKLLKAQQYSDECNNELSREVTHLEKLLGEETIRAAAFLFRAMEAEEKLKDMENVNGVAK